MKKPCQNCGEPVEQVPKRKEKKFCSPSCRVLACLKRKNDTGKKSKQKGVSKPVNYIKKKEKIAYKKTTKKSIDGSKLHRKVLDEVGVCDTGNNIVVQDLTKPTNQVTPITDPKQVKNAVINIKPKQSSGNMSFIEQRRQNKLK